MSNVNLTDKLRETAQFTSVQLTSWPISSWETDSGELSHSVTDFFSLVQCVSPQGSTHLLVKQLEPALVGLLTCVDNGIRYFALTARSEPGLHNICQFTCTIQSTPSNYLQKHGGTPTPYIDYFLHHADEPGAIVLHFSRQYDWGDLYLGKIKVFMVVQIPRRVELGETGVWVSEQDLRQLLATDFSVTTDLRVVSLYALHENTTVVPHSGDDFDILGITRKEGALGELTQVPLNPDLWFAPPANVPLTSEFPERHIVFVKTETSTREISSWEQPLMALTSPTHIVLYCALRQKELVFAVASHTQTGLGGQILLFPATDLLHSESFSLLSTSLNSAEGGRFYHHVISAELRQLESPTEQPGVQWLTFEELMNVCTQSTLTSLELRFALSLMGSE